MATLTASVQLLNDHIALGHQEQGHTLLLDCPEVTGGTELGFNGGHLMLQGWGPVSSATSSRRRLGRLRFGL